MEDGKCWMLFAGSDAEISQEQYPLQMKHPFQAKHRPVVPQIIKWYSCSIRKLTQRCQPQHSYIAMCAVLIALMIQM